MEAKENTQLRRILGRWISVGILATAMVLGFGVLHHAGRYPRTEDAEVFANFIGIAPQVDGPLIRLNVKDNQFVKKGEPLYEIDEQPYQYALENALSEQAALEGQIADEQRKIAALVSAVSVAEANTHSAEAEILEAERGVAKARAEWTYANNNLHRLEPLLAKQFVTVDQVDRARTTETAQSEALRQAESRLELAKAESSSAVAQHEQAGHAVTTLEPLINQRGAKAAAVKKARYDLEQLSRLRAFRCPRDQPHDFRGSLCARRPANVHADRRAHLVGSGEFPGGPTPAHHSRECGPMSMFCRSPNARFAGVVDSVGFGVTPDPDVIGRLEPGLPDVQRTLNWVHLASRFPVRVRVENPTPDLFRVGESAVVTIRGRLKMATIVQTLPQPARPVTWFREFLQEELAPYRRASRTGSPDDPCGDARHDHLPDISHPVRFSGRNLCTDDFS